MSKDAYYFSHDSNAKDDPKCMLLIDQLGLEGYGIFWVLIEVLRDQPEYSYPIKLVPILARRYNTTSEKMMTVIQKYDLFELNKNDNFFSLSLNKRMEKADEYRHYKSLAGKASAEKRRLLQLNTCSTSVEQPLNSCSTKKGKENENENILDWRNNYEVYLQELNESHNKLVSDKSEIVKQQQFYPNVDIELSIKKAVNNFWATEEGWNNKKKDKKKSKINWKTTLINSINLNKVYKSREEAKSEIKFNQFL